MSNISKRNSAPAFRCSMFSSDPVSRLSTQITRWPREMRKSHRCEPRKPAPPVTREVGMGDESSVRPASAMGELDHDLDVVVALLERVLPALERHRPGDQAAQPVLVRSE